MAVVMPLGFLSRLREVQQPPILNVTMNAKLQQGSRLPLHDRNNITVCCDALHKRTYQELVHRLELSFFVSACSSTWRIQQTSWQP